MNSEELFNESKKYIPGGVNSPVRAFEPYPFFVKEAKGSHIRDVDGNDYIDHCLAYGPILLGHCDNDVMADVKAQMEMGTAYGAPTENEIKLAKEVIDRVPCAEMVRFVSTGVEATMAAIRLARGYTQRDKMVKPGDSYSCVPDSLGVPADTAKNTLTVPYNDEEALVKLIEEEGENIACVIVEPVMGNIGCIQPKIGYLKFLRKITEENDILLIFDEVITGFRVSRGGAQQAYAGKREIMEYIAPSGPVYQAGTYSGNPVSVQAGLSTLKKLDFQFYGDLNKKSDDFRNNIADIVEDLELNIKVVGLASMFQIYFSPFPVMNNDLAQMCDKKRFLTYFIPPSQLECNFISGAHTVEDLSKTAEAVEAALKVAWEL